MALSDHVGLHTSSGQGGMRRDEGAGSVNRGVEGKTESQGTDVEKEGGDGQSGDKWRRHTGRASTLDVRLSVEVQRKGAEGRMEGLKKI